MVNPEDFRIGDIVRVSRDCDFPKGTVCTISEIGIIRSYKRKEGVACLIPINGNDYSSQEVWCCNIGGLPLTPEILGKNGWYFYEDIPTTYAHDRYGLEADFESQSEWVVVSIGNVFLHRFRYVHELQHILWAMGFDAKMTYPEDLNKQK